MILREFNFNNPSHRYWVALSQIQISSSDLSLDEMFGLMETIQNKYDNSVLQFFSEKYVLNIEHTYNACYFLEKAFLNKKNILNKKSLEFLLYLATKRQIKSGIEDFGIQLIDIKNGLLNSCIIASEENCSQILNDIKNKIGGTEVPNTIDGKSYEKFLTVKNYFQFSDLQIRTVLNSYEIMEAKYKLEKVDLTHLYLALNGLIREKMVLLSLEKV